MGCRLQRPSCHQPLVAFSVRIWSVCCWRGHMCRQDEATVLPVPFSFGELAHFSASAVCAAFYLLPRLEVSKLGKDWGLFSSKNINLLTLLPPIGGAPASSLWEWAEFNGLAPKKRMWQGERYMLAIRNVCSPCLLWSMLWSRATTLLWGSFVAFWRGPRSQQPWPSAVCHVKVPSWKQILQPHPAADDCSPGNILIAVSPETKL